MSPVRPGPDGGAGTARPPSPAWLSLLPGLSLLATALPRPARLACFQGCTPQVFPDWLPFPEAALSIENAVPEIQSLLSLRRSGPTPAAGGGACPRGRSLSLEPSCLCKFCLRFVFPIGRLGAVGGAGAGRGSLDRWVRPGTLRAEVTGRPGQGESGAREAPRGVQLRPGAQPPA